ncbi:MAG: Bcr/CflA family multidrug efflux MFS transporter [Chloroflexota bacterium]|nr:Bcr/CflA family multidrug efflux MFS transporter [Chloroflexota bacterium]
MNPSLMSGVQRSGMGDRTARRVGLTIILGALGAIAPLSIDMYLPALPALGRTFGTGASQIQLTLSAFVLGLALGQIVAGPLSDTLGRRRPLLVGLAGYVVTSLLCLLAPSAGALVALRFVQGAAGAAGIVIASAVVRDLYAGVAAARFFSLLMLVSGLAPILAPIIGAQVLRFTSWQGVFIVLAVLGTLLLLAVATGLRETLPRERRQRGGIRATVTTFRRLLADRAFLGYTLASGLAFAAMFAYISGSPFVLQEIYRVSPQQFSLLFGMNAVGLVVASQVNARLVGRVAPRRLLAGGLLAQAGGALVLLAVVTSGTIGLAGVVPALFVVVASLGFVRPNATMLALAGHPHIAGSAAALIGVLQFAIGAVAAPIAGLGGLTALPMAAVIAALSGGALAVLVLLGDDQAAA